MKLYNSLKQLILMGICAVLALSAIACRSTAADAPAPAAVSASRSLWIWDASVATNAQTSKELLDFCAAQHLDTLFLDLGDFDSATKKPDKDPKHLTSQMLGDFLEKCHAAGIKVQGLGGDPHFALRERHQFALDKMQRVLDYNAGVSAPRRLDGYQWDVEPYILDGFKTDQHDSILEQYLKFVETAVSMVQKSAYSGQFDLGFAVPFWFDKEVQSVAWKGKKQPAVFHVMEILSSLPQSYIAIMAYRDHASGSNGSIEVSQTEMDYAAAHTPKVGIWVGLETGKVEPASITFYGKTNADLEKAITEVNAAFHSCPNFRGAAIHHWASYREFVKR